MVSDRIRDVSQGQDAERRRSEARVANDQYQKTS